MTKYSIIIVDDEASGRNTLKILLDKHFQFYIESISFSKTYDEAKTNLESNKYDIAFLDINLQGKSSFDLLNLIPDATFVVFVTAYSEFMIQALRNKAFDYLVKPIKEEDLKDCLNRLQITTSQETNRSVLRIRANGLTRMIKTANLLYIEGDGPYSIICMKEERITVARTLKSLVMELGEDFTRIHKTYLVNRNYIKGINGNELILINNQKLPISRTGLKNI